MNHFNRRDFLHLAGLGAFAAPTLGNYAARPRKRVESEIFYVGTYTDGDSEGIYRCRFDAETGAVEVLGATGGVQNPSFLAIEPSGRYLYSTSETSEFDGEPGGGVYAYAIDETDGELSPINAQSSQGGGPCYVTATPQGSHVLVANYGGGSVAVLPTGEDGGLRAATDAAQHEGSSVNPRRQQGPHAHCVVLDASGRYAFAVDLGLDRVLIYQFDGDEGTLRPADPPWVAVEPGAGPRHLAFHPDGTRAYVINELNSTVTAFSYDAERGQLTETQTITTLPDGFSETNYPADLHVHPDGRFLYGSNRGHDSIVVYAIEPDSGKLSTVQHEPTGGAWPRNFGIDPSGRYLLAANQRSNNLCVFTIDARSGQLSPTGHVLDVPSPACVRFL